MMRMLRVGVVVLVMCGVYGVEGWFVLMVWGVGCVLGE